MASFQQMVSGRRQTRQAPVIQFVPGQTLTPCYFLVQVEPAIRHGLRELEDTCPRHAMTELALITYLMGMGFDYRTAKAIVESWESDETLATQGLLTAE